MPEIKPCPKCGGKAEFIKLYTLGYNGFVKCTECNAEGRVYTSKQNAVNAWNEGRSIYLPPKGE